MGWELGPAVTTLWALAVDAIVLNCATGPNGDAQEEPRREGAELRSPVPFRADHAGHDVIGNLVYVGIALMGGRSRAARNANCTLPKPPPPEPLYFGGCSFPCD